MSDGAQLLRIVQGVEIWQDPFPLPGRPLGGRIHYIADMDVDVDGAQHAYRFDNLYQKGALDDIINSAGYPNGEWWNVLARDPKKPDQPYIDQEGFCVSITSYQRQGFSSIDRQRYLDAAIIPYAVPPGIIRKLCRGVLLGCKSRITDVVTGVQIDCVCGDFSGNTIGEASLAAARHFDPKLSARNGDGRKRYRYEFWPGIAAKLGAETFTLIPAAA